MVRGWVGDRDTDGTRVRFAVNRTATTAAAFKDSVLFRCAAALVNRRTPCASVNQGCRIEF